MFQFRVQSFIVGLSRTLASGFRFARGEGVTHVQFVHQEVLRGGTDASSFAKPCTRPRAIAGGAPAAPTMTAAQKGSPPDWRPGMWFNDELGFCFRIFEYIGQCRQ